MWTRKGNNTGFCTILETVAGLQRTGDPDWGLIWCGASAAGARLKSPIEVDIIPGRDHIAKDEEKARQQHAEPPAGGSNDE
jgi:hypothetical protein